MPINLASFADLLRPGLWGISQQYDLDRNVDIVCNYVNDTLELTVDGHSRELFTRSELEDDSYKAEFRPRVIRTLEGSNAQPT